MDVQNQRTQERRKLRSKNKVAASETDRDDRLFPDDEVFTCADCGLAIGKAKEMFNLRLRGKPEKIMAEEMLKLVRCGVCAARVAKGGKKPGAHGSGVFHLQATLRMVDARRRSVHDKDRHRHRPPAGPSREELRRRKEQAIVAWGHAYATSSFGDLVQDVLPDDRFGFCGVPPCGNRLPQDQDRAGVSYLTRTDGVLTRICGRCAAVLGQIARRHRDDDRYKRLLSTKDRSLAERIAAGRVGEARGTASGNGQSPLSAGMTAERKAHKKKRNVANRERKRQENHERALSHGNTKKNQQEGGKKRKKKQ